NTASGTNSIAFGIGNVAGGAYSSALGHESVADGQYALAVGAGANAETLDGVAMGRNAGVLAEGGTAVGARATVTEDATNAVALGEGSIADAADTVSVGSADNLRRVTNVGDAVGPTDAVNLRTLQAALEGVEGGGGVSEARVREIADAGDATTLTAANDYTDARIAEIDAVTEAEVREIRSEEHTSELQSRENLVCRL